MAGAASAAPARSFCGRLSIGDSCILRERPLICCCFWDREQSQILSGRLRVRIERARNGRHLWRLRRNTSWSHIIRVERSGLSKMNSHNRVSEGQHEDHRTPFSLDLAVLLAGFAFESYNTPVKDEGVREMDTEDCETTYLAKEYVQALYDGQLSIKLKNGSNFPGLDLWGTSDPYVVLRLRDCSVQSKTVWATKDPFWNEELKLNVKDPTSQILKIEAWDANVVTAHRRLGNSALSLENACDGKIYNLEVQLEGMGGGGTVYLEVQYKSFAEIEAERSIGFQFARMFRVDALEKAFRSVVGDNQISVGDFMMNFYRPFQEDGVSESTREAEKTEASINAPARDRSLEAQGSKDKGFDWNPFSNGLQEESVDRIEAGKGSTVKRNDDSDDEVAYWKAMADAVAEKLKPLGLDLSSSLSDWDGFKLSEDVKNLGLASQKKAEVEYIKHGLTLDESEKTSEDGSNETDEENRGFGLDSILRLDLSPPQSVENLRKQTEKLLGVWTIFNKSSWGQSNDDNENKKLSTSVNDGSSLRILPENKEVHDSNNAGLVAKNGESYEPYAAMFSTAESAMEAWALLATTMGGASLLKSDFKKICFVENGKTDTQVAIWRDERRRRLVVAFRGTEQTKWKDVVTDISLLGTGFNPERVGGSGSKEEVLVHAGFLTAYDSVKAKLFSLVRSSINCSEDNSGSDTAWHIFVTGHSLGGALATLFALDLATCKLEKDGKIRITMYNYGSPRVGNRRFAEIYNKAVKDSWRVVNHRDIVPTVPRLMGYCHVAQPIYLTAYDNNLKMSDLLDDGYQGDVIGEATPDIIIEEIMKGEQTVLQKLLDTEIAMLRAMRDGSAVMQHMEDFYYITLLQRVEARISHSPKQ